LSSEKSKAEMANKLRKILRVDIKFEKLSKDDLSKLYKLLTHSSFLFWLKLYRQTLKNKLLDRHPLLRKADLLSDVLLGILRR